MVVRSEAVARAEAVRHLKYVIIDGLRSDTPSFYGSPVASSGAVWQIWVSMPLFKLRLRIYRGPPSK